MFAGLFLSPEAVFVLSSEGLEGFSLLLSSEDFTDLSSTSSVVAPSAVPSAVSSTGISPSAVPHLHFYLFGGKKVWKMVS